MKKGTNNESFETKGNSNFTALYWDMIDSEAWGALSGNDITTYIHMRRKYSRNVSHGIIYGSNKDNISMPKEEYLKFIGQCAFSNSIDKLIDTGFVRVVEYKSLGGSRKVIIYGFVDKWKDYGKPNFLIKEEWKRSKNRM